MTTSPATHNRPALRPLRRREFHGEVGACYETLCSTAAVGMMQRVMARGADPQGTMKVWG